MKPPFWYQDEVAKVIRPHNSLQQSPQDYLLTIDNSDRPADYTITLSIVDG